MSITHIASAPQQEASEARDMVRTPPHDLLAEQSTIGGMLLSKDALADVVETVRAVDFYVPKHEIIFDAIHALYAAGDPIDVIAVTDRLTKTGELQRAGGAEYLHELAGIVPTAANAGYYASIVAERAVLRRLVEAGTRIAQKGYEAEGDVVDLVNEAQAEIYAVTGGVDSEDYVPLSEALIEARDEMDAAQSRTGELTGVPTGFIELDKLTNGLHAGQMIIIAARPGLGKSTLALDIARAAAIRHDIPAIFFSLEMSRAEIAMRLISAEASVPLKNMRSGGLTQDDLMRIARTSGAIEQKPLYIDDSANMTLVEIRAKCRRMKQKAGLGVIIVDYLQLLTSGKRVESRQQEVSEFSRALKLLAKELEVPIIALSQLNRNSEQRSDKTPQISDLRESGSLEQDADIVILLHRDTSDEAGGHRGDGSAQFRVAKHRNGPTANIDALFQGHYSRFADAPVGVGFGPEE